MPLEEKLPEWNNPGTEPSQSKKDSGYAGGEKPPAGWFNWFFNRTYKAISELREKVFLKEDADKLATKTSVDNHITDYVSHATYAGEATHNGNDLTVTLKGLTEYKDGVYISLKAKNNTNGITRLRGNNLAYKNIVNAAGGNVTNFKAGTIYSVRYSSTTDSFILQGERGEEGTATASDVLTGKNISTSNGLVDGLIPIRRGGTVTPGTLTKSLESGYYPQDIVIAGDTDLKPTNIRSGVELFGVFGTMSPVEHWKGSLAANSGVGGQQVVLRGLSFRPKVIYAKLAQQDTQGNTGTAFFLYIDKGFANKTYDENFYVDWNGNFLGRNNITVHNDGFEMSTPWASRDYNVMVLG